MVVTMVKTSGCVRGSPVLSWVEKRMGVPSNEVDYNYGE
jgi:hypothetical protein